MDGCESSKSGGTRFRKSNNHMGERRHRDNEEVVMAIREWLRI